MNYHKIKNRHDKHDVRRVSVMNIGSYAMRAILDAIKKVFPAAETPLGSTPSVRNNNGRHRFHSHAPNDGRWHMKFHRGRIR